jgi:hypothetical protein
MAETLGFGIEIADEARPGIVPGSASKAGEDGRSQTTEEAPGQPGVVGEHDAVRLGDHAAYIAGRFHADNE